MSIMQISAVLYQHIYTDAVADYIGQGLDLKAAREMAAEQMNNSFACTEISDVQYNHDTLREEMQMTDGDFAAWQNPRQSGGTKV